MCRIRLTRGEAKTSHRMTAVDIITIQIKINIQRNENNSKLIKNVIKVQKIAAKYLKECSISIMRNMPMRSEMGSESSTKTSSKSARKRRTSDSWFTSMT